MLLCSSKIPVTDKLTPSILVDLVSQWIQASRHYDIDPFEWDGSEDFTVKGHNGELLQIGTFNEDNICAVHFVSVDSRSDKWTTDCVLDRDESVLAFQLYRDSSEAEYINQAFSIPNIIKIIMEKGYCAGDNGLDIGGDIIPITRENVSLAADVMLRQKEYSLPVIYVSCISDNYHKLDPKRLAEKLNGVAHVMVETTREVSRELQYRTDSKNPYVGGVEVYYPKGSRRFLPDQISSAATVYNSVFQHINQLVIEDKYLWSHLYSVKLNHRLSSEMKQSSELSDTYEAIIDSMDEEIKNLKSQIHSANSMIEQLNYINNERTPIEGTPVIVIGQEQDLYKNEQKMFLLEMLERERANALEGTRRRHILESIVEANKIDDSLNARREKLKNALKGYSRMNAGIERDLTDLGFTMTGDGKHYKLVFCGDNRYWGSLSKTASDQRSGTNFASDLIKMLFQ